MVEFTQLPPETQMDVFEHASRGERYPDPTVAEAAEAWAESVIKSSSWHQHAGGIFAAVDVVVSMATETVPLTAGSAPGTDRRQRKHAIAILSCRPEQSLLPMTSQLGTLRGPSSGWLGLSA